MSPEPHRLAAIRCADQDRELVAQLLNNAYSDGRLTFEEHADRIAKAYDAKTFGDLDSLTTDLVAPERRPAPTASATQVTPSPSYPPSLTDFTGGNAVLSTFKASKLDTVASELHLNSWLGEVKLDLVDATFASRHTTIHVGGLMGEIKIRVPEGVDVNLSRVTTVMGETKVDGIVTHPDGIHLTLVGMIVMGEIKVLGPGVANRRKYEKFTK